MFDLDKEVAAWSEAVHAARCGSAADVAELTDHLHCEIELARARGLSDEQAFAAAVAKVGPARELAAEHAKNRSLLARTCALTRDDLPARSGSARGLLRAHAILWAALMIATAMTFAAGTLSSGAAGTGAFTWLLTGVLVPGWWASELILRRALRTKPAAGA